MRIAVACDHAGLTLKEEVVEGLQKLGHAVEDFGTHDNHSVDYPDFASRVARAVREGQVDAGVLVCGTGIGMSIVANKYRGVRAAVCTTEFEARMARSHNDANVLCMGERIIGAGVAADTLRAFLDGKFAGGRHADRVKKIMALEHSQKETKA